MRRFSVRYVDVRLPNDTSCVATSALIIFCLLQMWRVDRVLQMSRRRVKVVHVLSPLIILLMVTIAVLIAWTVEDRWTWERELIDVNPPHL